MLYFLKAWDSRISKIRNYKVLKRPNFTFTFTFTFTLHIQIDGEFSRSFERNFCCSGSRGDWGPGSLADCLAPGQWHAVVLVSLRLKDSPQPAFPLSLTVRPCSLVRRKEQNLLDKSQLFQRYWFLLRTSDMASITP